MPQTASGLSPCEVRVLNVAVPSSKPLPGAVTLSDFAQQFDGDVEIQGKLAEARRALASDLDSAPTLRRLRLQAGFSQAKLAEAAKTTQSYIARIEAGTLDPGTDMVVRMAEGLSVTPEMLFTAIRAQRKQVES